MAANRRLRSRVVSFPQQRAITLGLERDLDRGRARRYVAAAFPTPRHHQAPRRIDLAMLAGRDVREGSTARFGIHGPVLEMKVSKLDPDRQVRCTTAGGFPEWQGTTVTWEITPHEHGGHEVWFSHEGWPEKLPARPGVGQLHVGPHRRPVEEVRGVGQAGPVLPLRAPLQFATP